MVGRITPLVSDVAFALVVRVEVVVVSALARLEFADGDGTAEGDASGRAEQEAEIQAGGEIV